MTSTIVEQLASFAHRSDFQQLPPAVVNECKRLLLDSIGCALGGIEHPKGRIGIDYGRLVSGGDATATIIGSRVRASVLGAAFANGELISALDFDAILPPGHVSPYVLPGALAVAESTGASGRKLINAIAVSHEMSYRLGKAMDYLRDIKDGQISPPKVFGYSSTVFGATAAIGMLKGLPAAILPHALGIAGCIAPVNSHRAWSQHAPSTTIKYLMAGVLAQTSLTAASMAELGHRGDVQVLDDAEFGFPRFIGSTRWEPSSITAELGSAWRFPAEQSYKPYPHCRILHALLDCLIQVVEEHDIRPHEIEGIKALVEGFVHQPIWLLNDITHVTDAQFSIAHGLALGAHRVPPGKAWQDPALVFSPSVMELMAKVSHELHPDYVSALKSHAASRPARIEVRARGRTFVAERQFPKGSPSPEPETTMSTDELVEKFRRNAEGVISAGNIDTVVGTLLNLEQVDDVASVMHLLSQGADATWSAAERVPEKAEWAAAK